MLVSGKVSVTTAARPVVAAPPQQQQPVWDSVAAVAAGPDAMHPFGTVAASMPQLRQWPVPSSGPAQGGPAPSNHRHERYPVLAAEPAGQFPPPPQCAAVHADPAAPGRADISAGNAFCPSAGMAVDPQASRLPCGREEVHYVVLEVLEEGRDELTLRLMNEFKVREAIFRACPAGTLNPSSACCLHPYIRAPMWPNYAPICMSLLPAQRSRPLPPSIPGPGGDRPPAGRLGGHHRSARRRHQRAGRGSGVLGPRRPAARRGGHAAWAGCTAPRCTAIG